jgi:S-adenosylmethionine/arginine decarboxylase-like enzyme
MTNFGKEAIIKLQRCSIVQIRTELRVKNFLRQMVKEIGMVPYGEPHVHRFGEGDLLGVSGFQFIMTSSISIHCDERDKSVNLNVYSCKDFDEDSARKFAESYFKAKSSTAIVFHH